MLTTEADDPHTHTVALTCADGPKAGETIDLEPGEDHYTYRAAGFIHAYSVTRCGDGGEQLTYAGKLACPTR